MMYPSSITVENFMGWRGQHTVQLGDQGLLHVAGRNLDDPGNDSNGSGKSTLLEALTWCLFGEGLPRPQGNAERGVRADEVLNDTLGKQCRVLVAVDGGAHPIRIARWRKWRERTGDKASNGVRLVVGDVVYDTLDEAETDRLICQHLGITYDIWARGVVFGQEASFNFCDATATQRADILTTVRGLEDVDRWLDACRDEKRGLVNLLATESGKLGVLRAHHARLLEADPHAVVAQWEAQRAQRLLVARQRQSELETRGKAQAAALSALPVATHPGEAPAVGVTPVVTPALLAAEEQARRACQQGDAELAQLGAAVKAARTNLDGVRGRVGTASCPTCGQVISEAHRVACVSEAERLLGEATQRWQAVEGRGDALKAAYQRATQAVAAEKAAHLEQDVASRTRLTAYAAQLSAYQAAVTARSRLETELATTRAQWSSVAEQLATIGAEINPHVAAVAAHEAEVVSSEAGVRAAEAEQVRLARAQDVCLWWEAELPRFKTWLFDALAGELAAEANRWLKVMSGGVIWIEITTQKQTAKGAMRDEIDVQIYRWNPDGTTTQRPYRVWSGGEKRRVSLAVDLGLSRLMARRASQAYSFLALDEADRHLDAEGRRGLRAVLGELRNEKSTALVITHDPEFRAMFDSELLVTKTRGTVLVEQRKV